MDISHYIIHRAMVFSSNPIEALVKRIGSLYIVIEGTLYIRDLCTPLINSRKEIRLITHS